MGALGRDVAGSEVGTPYGVLCCSIGNQGCREWLAGPLAIHRSSLRDGACWESASTEPRVPGACSER